jgi:putative serine protease PepD
MSDTPDPFAARPYTPPSERNAESAPDSDAQQPPGNGAGDAIETPEAESPVEAAPVVEPAAPTAEAREAPAAPNPEPPSDSAPDTATTHRFEPVDQEPTEYAAPAEDDVPEMPVTPAAPQSASPTWPTASTYATDPDPRPTSTIPESSVFPTAGGSAAASGHTPSTYATSAHVPPVRSEFDEPSRGSGRKVAGVLAVALIGAAAGIGGAAAYDEYIKPDRSSISTVDLPADDDKAPTGQVEKVAASVLPSVVQIMVSGDDAAGSGTGIIISDDGEILTNNHVVDVAAGDDGKIVVVFSDGTNTSAKIVGQDPVTDVAVIKAAKISGLTPATLGSNRTLQVGQTVVAVGSPFGLSSTVTAGIISALNRPVTEPGDDDSSSGTTFPGIQTDAAINPGNSGGPLVDLKGRVIGINSVIQSSGGGLFGGEAGSIGLGFAIPIDLAKSVASQLLDGKTVEHAQIGVTVSAAVADNKLTTIGALVREVKGGSAGAKAGLKAGDIITAVNNIPVARSEGLIAAIRAYEPGEKVTLTYLRDDKKRTTKVTLGSDGGKITQ